MEQSSANPSARPAAGLQPKAEGGLLQRQAVLLQARLQPVVRIASAIVDKVRLQAVVSSAAGLWLWGVLFYPFSSFGNGWIVVLGIVAFGALLLPAGVLFVFWFGLRELIRVPDKLVAIAGQGEARTGELKEAVAGTSEPRKARRLWRFFRTVLELRSLIIDSKELLLQYAVVVRVANPVFIGVLFFAFVASLLLIFAALVSMLVVAF